jgi:peptide chain release factor
MTDGLWLQISAGQGPAECARAVVKVAEAIRDEAVESGVSAGTLEVEPGPEAGTAWSVLLTVNGPNAREFAARWRGTVQWVARSPFRSGHKRRNWFVSVEVLEPPQAECFDLRAVRFETMRASGPGGQHVNRTESAVRVTHLPTGIQSSASEERSQHRNKALALARLARKLEESESSRHAAAVRTRWQQHQSLIRGNAIRVLRDA